MNVILGTVESNSQVSEAVRLNIRFNHYNKKGPIYYPPFDKVSVDIIYMFRFTL